MFTGDWLYMLFMHQACVYETEEQYVKSNKILTAVVKEALLKGHINDILKDAIQAFQVKMNVKQEYLAYYVRKHMHNCYDAMTTSPVESINCHIKHRSKASTLNNTSKSLMLITDANVYHVKVTTFGKQRFLKCNCLHYERCGIPCSHILKITDKIEELMIKIQHLKVYQVHYGDNYSNLTSKLMQGSSLQTTYEDMGMPLLDQCLNNALKPKKTL
jgi:hypothetical protein